jgi:acetyltransferase-like isoleucine patch superfamily enzyme
VKKKWNRVLPLNEYFSNRWVKANYLKFGEGSSIYDSAYVYGNVSVGKNTWIGPFVILDGSNDLFIGDNCDISAGVQIYTHDTIKKHINKSIQCSNSPENDIGRNSVYIGDNVYVGPNTVISKGIKIENNVIIGANSFVNKNIPANFKAIGSPVKLIPIDYMTES